MKIVGKAPSPDALIRDGNLPRNSKFIGWGVNAEPDDSFLQSVRDRRDFSLRTFCAGPGDAMLFKSPSEAGEIAISLAYPAYVVAIFDIGNRYAVARVGGNSTSSFGL
jgi:hypothetical protein